MTGTPYHGAAHAMPFGALLDGKNTRFRIFAPAVEHMEIELIGLDETLVMDTDGSGWHELITPAASTGSLYLYRLPDGTRVPDPASRFQPKDVHGPSEVVDASSYVWNDAAWRGRPWTEAILYELHFGTFTPEGTFAAAMDRLPYLVELGITAIELMCVADFAGNRNWGYDGVLLYAPDSAYGRPEDMKAFIDRAHALGIMIILDVVYNHFGPEGDFIAHYFPEICSNSHQTPWGHALNFDGPHSDVVREFIFHNALYWIEEFHVDGLRLDASHTMIDESEPNILDELRDRVSALDCVRPIHLILENEQNIACRLGRNAAGEPTGYTAQWNHDVTHLLGAVYSDLCTEDKLEETQRLTTALAEGFNIAAHESGAHHDCELPPTAFISFIQTHDLVGNRVFGDRVSAVAKVDPLRAISSIYLLLPQIPMLFMGEEWAASTPFPFFCDYHGQLADKVRAGRIDQLSHLDPAPTADELHRAPDPQAESTLRSAQLLWDELSEPDHAAWLDWYKRLLAVRKGVILPLLSGLQARCADAHVVAPGAFTVQWQLRDDIRLSLAANLCKTAREDLPAAPGRVVWTTGSASDDGHFGPWSVRWCVEDR
jgi:malto-oligosyltrehalose trehalohydrolase